MADSFSKKEREKKKRQRKKEKELRRQEKREEGTSPEEIMYVDHNGNFVSTPPEDSPEAEVKLEDIQVSVPKKEEIDPDAPREGFVKFFDYEKGFGFIIDPNTKESFFVHHDSLVDQISDSDKVIFERGEGEKGPVALNVTLKK
ncbi:cold shock domain-containing protein [bacterium]|nr:cold shock domain-containing protein [bacterium]